MKRRPGLMRLPLVTAALFVAVLASCGSPSSTSANPTSLRLRVGERSELPGGYALMFDSVVQDSRCPTGVECVWAGNAVVAMTYISTDGRRVPFRLETYQEVKRDTTIDGHLIHLADVSPYPEKEKTIPRDQYVVMIETR